MYVMSSKNLTSCLYTPLHLPLNPEKSKDTESCSPTVTGLIIFKTSRTLFTLQVNIETESINNSTHVMTRFMIIFHVNLMSSSEESNIVHPGNDVR